MMPDKIKTAIIGVGRWGRNIARELSAVSSLVAFVSEETTEEELKSAHNLPLRRLTADQVFLDSTIAAVAIATPIPLLSSFAQAALETGKHVFVEKPLAETSAQARSLADMAAARGLLLATGYVFLYHPAYAELKRRLDIARIRKVILQWDKFGTFAESIEQTLLTHHLALALHLLGQPMSGTIRRGAGERTHCDAIEARLTYENFEAISRIDRVSARSHHSIEIEMTDGAILVWDDTALYYAASRRIKPEVIYQSKQTALGIEISDFVSTASGKVRPLPTSGEFAAKVLAVGEMLKPVK